MEIRNRLKQKLKARGIDLEAFPPRHQRNIWKMIACTKILQNLHCYAAMDYLITHDPFIEALRREQTRCQTLPQNQK